MRYGDNRICCVVVRIISSSTNVGEFVESGKSLLYLYFHVTHKTQLNGSSPLDPHVLWSNDMKIYFHYDSPEMYMHNCQSMQILSLFPVLSNGYTLQHHSPIGHSPIVEHHYNITCLVMITHLQSPTLFSYHSRFTQHNYYTSKYMAKNELCYPTLLRNRLLDDLKDHDITTLNEID